MPMTQHLLMDDATKDYPNIVDYFKKQGKEIFIHGDHPVGDDVIFEKHTFEWLGYTTDYCLNHDEMFCEKCFPEDG